ncbi:type III secretion system inner membrane ring lipoprotein SctJ [Burkholderia sp. BDU5]|uniref:type III secretion system inner membrane ring lipoprotein SctJ n=1 Tax=Burkholderia sp. BDU5 TaxID=1385590 RepID=UPI0007531961|nr:type III secretion inner membrane ring lipoprotein SctJ [Burkholderia sp. BDU5]KVE41576.1 type III secretion apparatus lipoprotein, YscJ/HrcJ family [Burkholderia sp. BDU5]
MQRDDIIAKRPFLRRSRSLWLAAFAAATLTACGNAALFDQIGESDANEMLSVLGRAGIPAGKDQRSADGWRLSVASSDVALALEILNSAGLPRERFKSIGELFPKEGLIATPVEEHMRSIYAISQELSKTISIIDGVISARVHLNIPKREPLLRTRQTPTASVFVKYRAEVNMQQNTLAIKDLVVGAVKDLDRSNVTVALFPWSPQSAMPASTEYVQTLGMAVSPRSYGRLMWLVFLPWILLGAGVAAGLFVVARSMERDWLGRMSEGKLKRWLKRIRQSHE